MIAIALNGGLGNQLFEYAFAYTLHKKLNTSFLLIKHGDPIILYRYFNTEKNIFYYIDQILFDHKGFKLLFSHYLRGVFVSIIGRFAFREKKTIGNKEIPNRVLKTLKDDTVYEGYFQSEHYFRTHSNELKKLLTIKTKYVSAFEKKFSWLNSKHKIITIHIRRTDYQHAFSYLDLGNDDLSLPFTYYHNVIDKIRHSNNFYIFISDDIEKVQKEFQSLKQVYFSKENEINDFQLMLNADVCVIANSSFSWWAAYLNEKQKAVYCPEYYLGFEKKIEYPSEIYPENWIRVPVY